jgi:AmiR/NasT family two-component response regulator
MRILIAEDEELILREIHDILQQAGHVVLPYAYTADDAIRKAEKYLPDLVVLDINFNNDARDGIFAADYIRKHLNRPVVFVTGAVDQQTVDRAKLTSPYSYVLKPIEKHKILVSVNLAHYNWEFDQKKRQHQRDVARAYTEGQDKQKIQLEDALHEGLGVRLSVMGFYISMLKEVYEKLLPAQQDGILNKSLSYLNELEQLLKDATQSLRRISFDLVPNTLLNNGLVAGIQALEKRLMDADPELDLNLEIEFESIDETELRLSQELELGIYWLVFDLVDYYRNYARINEIVVHICLSCSLVKLMVLENQLVPSWYNDQDTTTQFSPKNLEARLNLLDAQVFIHEDQPSNRPYRIIQICIPVPQNQLIENGSDQAASS